MKLKGHRIGAVMVAADRSRPRVSFGASSCPNSPTLYKAMQLDGGVTLNIAVAADRFFTESLPSQHR